MRPHYIAPLKQWFRLSLPSPSLVDEFVAALTLGALPSPTDTSTGSREENRTDAGGVSGSGFSAAAAAAGVAFGAAFAGSAFAAAAFACCCWLWMFLPEGGLLVEGAIIRLLHLRKESLSDPTKQTRGGCTTSKFGKVGQFIA